MSLRDTIMDSLKVAMKEHNKLRLSTLRLINAAIKDRDIANRGADKPLADNTEIQAILAKMIKQREESARMYHDADRQAQAEEEEQEIAIITDFLPPQLSDGEIKAAVEKALKDNEAVSLRDMGRVMAQLKQLYTGQMDFAKAGALVRKSLQ